MLIIWHGLLQEAAARGLQHPALELERNHDRSRLGQLCPDLLPQNSAPGSTDASTVLGGPSLEWAVACARSRAFQGGADVFCIVPFVDMVNHSFNAVNAKVQVPEGGSWETGYVSTRADALVRRMRPSLCKGMRSKMCAVFEKTGPW